MKKKGISPLISVVLLVVFTIAIATMVMNWTKGYTRDTTETMDESSEELLDCSKVSVKITDVFITLNSGGDNATRVFVSNEGVSTTISSASVYNTSGAVCPLNISNTGTLDKGAIVMLENNSCNVFNKDCSNFHKATVTTPCAGGGDDFTIQSNVVCNLD